jgi:lipopolysaccharide export system protein LptA
MIIRDRTDAAQMRRLSLLLALAGAAALWTVPAVRAQAPGTGFANSYSANASKPLDIEADTLEVDDKKKTAVFKGNVSATQGDMNLKSNEIYVTYTASGAKTASASSSDAASPLGGTGQITQINAMGNVFVTMAGEKAEKQTAKSDKANFDVPSQIITLTGNVELTRGENRQNVIVGNKLVINIAAGTSHFENSGLDSEGKPTRMRAILTPPPKKEKEKEKPKEGAN